MSILSVFTYLSLSILALLVFSLLFYMSHSFNKYLNAEFNFGFPAGTFDNLTGEPYPFSRTGDIDLSYSIKLNQKFYRWQNNNWLFSGEEFYKMFEDGPWKWSAQGRFAGKGITCGHYFGLSIAAASEEASHYNIDQQNATLIELQIQSKRILDLTHPETIYEMFRNHVNNHEVVSNSYYKMLQELVERGNGGNVVTDYFGYIACKQGYEGILFFSTRAIDILSLQLKDLDLEAFEYKTYFKKLRADRNLLNVVFFSGATIISKTQTFTISDFSAIENLYFGESQENIYRILVYNDDYQEERKRFTLTAPKYLR